MNIVPALNLNKHREGCVDRSLVYANNIVLSNDIAVLTNEKTFDYPFTIDTISESIPQLGETEYRYLSLGEIVGSINCNNEIVLFITVNHVAVGSPTGYCLVRINDTSVIDARYIDNPNGDYFLEYHGGILKGDFTYNRNNELIIAFTEYAEDDSVLEPLRTVVFNDVYLPSRKISIQPEVTIPAISNYKYVTGAWYKGQNYIFIRYKIDKNNYTRWLFLNYNIYNDVFKNKAFIDATITAVDENNGNTSHTSILNSKTYYSDDRDICDNAISLEFENLEDYEYYQVGVIVKRKDFNKCFITMDIPTSINTVTLSNEYFSQDDSSIDEMTYDYYNYFNVKTVHNYNNKLFIANYHEQEEDHDALQAAADAIVAEIDNRAYYDPDNDNSPSSPETSDDVTKRLRYFTFGKSPNPYYLDTHYGINRKHYMLEDAKLCEFSFYWNGSKMIISGFNNNLDTFETSSYIRLSWLIYDVFMNAAGGNNGAPYVPFMLSDIKLNQNKFNEDYFNKCYTRYHDDIVPLGSLHLGYNYVNEGAPGYNSDTDRYSYLHSHDDGNLDNFVLVPLILNNGTYPYFYLFHYDSATQTYIRIGSDVIGYIVLDGIPVYNSEHPDGHIRTEDKLIDLSAFNSYLTESYLYTFKHNDAYVWSGTQIEIFLNRIEIRTLIANEFYQFFIHFVDKYGNRTLGYPITIDETRGVRKYVNLHGENVYRIPNNLNIDDPGIGVSSSPQYINGKYVIYRLAIKNLTIPDGYVGWYISYAEFESITKLHAYRLGEVNSYGLHNGTTFGTEIDILDKIDINIEEIEWLDYITDGNTHVERKKDLEFKLGGDLDNVFSGTYMIVNSGDNFDNISCPIRLLSNPLVEDDGDKVILYNYKEKTLIPISKVYYKNIDWEDDINKEEIIVGNYNGVITQFEAIDFYSQKCVFDQSLGCFIGPNGNVIYDKANLDVITWFDYCDYFNESKCFLNKPSVVINGNFKSSKPNFNIGYIVDCRDSIDLFQNKNLRFNELHPKVDINYNKDYDYVTVFDKTIRRSNVIADESLENSWRKFEPTQYINIKENKGIIMNITSIGNTLLVHTYDSLFQFDFNDRLNSNGGVVAVEQNDIFDSRYKELFNSDLGYGGLQERDAWVVGDFGYIWFCNDFQRFFTIGENAAKVIDDQIHDRYKVMNVHNVIFADDKENNRLLIRYDYDYNSSTNTEIISFNYNKQAFFVSFHDYVDIFYRSCRTKNKLFFINNFRNVIYKFTNKEKYNQNFDISILVNTDYKDVKFIEYIKYRINKIRTSDTPNNEVLKNRSQFLEPYSGDELVVASDFGTSSLIDLRVTNVLSSGQFPINPSSTNMKKPVWELGMWNLNNIINVGNKNYVAKYGSDSRLFGNYFIFNFRFVEAQNSTDVSRVEFEQFHVQFTKIRR